jgi:hypothetical protein
VWVQLLSLDVVFYLAADILYDGVDDLESIEFSLEGSFSCFVECLFQDEAGDFFFGFSVFLLLLELLDLGDGFVDEDQALLKLFHAGDFLLPFRPHCLHYPGVLKQFLPVDASLMILA